MFDMDRRFLLSILTALSFLAFVSAGCMDEVALIPEPLQVHFIDVGQGDCIFVEFPNGTNLLVDAGPDTSGYSLTSYLDMLGVSGIDRVVITHPDSDHYGGFFKILDSYDVETVYQAFKEKDYHLYESLNEKIESLYRDGLVDTQSCYAGDTLDAGLFDEAIVHVLNPPEGFLDPAGEEESESNLNSIVLSAIL